jgi:type II secretory pathway pseudopilin PulG
MRNLLHGRIRARRAGEDGYMMVAVMFMLAVLIISMAVAAPQVKREIQRDREVETMQRGKQYIRAIQLYYRKFHAYPPNIDALVKTQEIRFLRKKYVDPTTGKEEWKPIQFGQNKAPTAMGFFGQPIGGSSIAGIGPGGGNGLNGTSGTSGQTGSSSPFGGNSTGGINGGSNLFGNSQNTNSPGTGLGSSSTDPSSGSSSSSSGTGSGSTGSSGTGSSGTGFGSGQTFGGAGIIGFSPQSPKESILVYKKKTHYNEWEFVYDPMAEQMTAGTSGAGLGGQPVGTSPIGGSTTGGSPGFGSSTSQAPFSNPTTTPTPAPPQQ